MFSIYSSSAGSGKTYTLTKEYLKLALSDPSPLYFRHILAVTFTNAAANEMKERILSSLRTFSGDSAGEASMFQDILRELYPETQQDAALAEEASELIRRRAKAVFTHLLHHYSDFAVMTIDKFTQRLVSSFASELGLSQQYEVSVTRELLDEAVDMLLARIGQEGEEVITEIVEEYYRTSAEEGKGWSVLPAQLREISGVMVNETGYLALKRLAHLSPANWRSIRTQLLDFERKKKSTIQQLAQKAVEIIEHAGLAPSDFKNGGSGIGNYFVQKSQAEKIWSEPGANAKKTVANNDWYSKTTPKPIKQTIEQMAPALAELFEQIEAIREDCGAKVALYELLQKKLYHLSLLGEIRQEFEVLLKTHNQVHISDFNRILAGIIAHEPVPFIFERLGEKFNHILVDEFQDTSKLQFGNLLPLIENALSKGYLNLIVGDAKQAIYRFRGGDMDLLVALNQHDAEKLSTILTKDPFQDERVQTLLAYADHKNLRANRRSFSEITAFNNGFFEFVTTLHEQNPLVKAVFDAHFQQEIPENAATGGRIQVEFLDATDTEDESEEGVEKPHVMVARTLSLITELLSNKSFTHADIAILCRKKKEAQALANALKARKIPLISDDSLSLSSSVVIRFLTSFLQVLHTPDSRLARYEACYLYVQAVRRQPLTSDVLTRLVPLSKERGLASFLAFFEEFGSEFSTFELLKTGVYELCEKLVGKFQLAQQQTENEYLFRFMDVVYEYTSSRSNHLGDFLTYWNEKKNDFSITIPANTNAVRITTIHKSKGLEYPVVIIPYAHWACEPNSKIDTLWAELEELRLEELSLPQAEGDTKTLPVSLVSYLTKHGDSIIQEQFEDEKHRVFLENLNLLYVAFTRPVQRLYILSTVPKSTSSIRVNTLLYEYLNRPDAQPSWQEEQAVYVLADGQAGRQVHKKDSKQAENFVLKTILSHDRTGALRLRRLADRLFDVETFEPKKDWYQRVKTALLACSTQQSVEGVLLSLRIEGLLHGEEAAELAPTLLQWIRHPELAPFFEKQNASSLTTSILLPNGKVIQADRIRSVSHTELHLLTVVAGAAPTTALRELKKMAAVYKSYGIERIKGVVLTLENEQVETIDL
jgi:ATP-dependent exoDNAse (exonuclease V) beta subunit